MRYGVLLLTALTSLVACSAAPDDELARDDAEVRAATCKPAFEEVDQLLTLRKLDYSERDVAVAEYLWAVGLEGSRDAFVYLKPEDHANVRTTAERLKALLTGKYKSLAPLVDSVSAKSVTQNLYGAPALATSFHCLGLPSQSHALRDEGVGFEEKSVEPTAKMRELFLHDGRDASIGWYDTVLEQPYQLVDGYEVGIESVEEIRLSNKRVALRVTIGAPAIATDSCQQAEDETWPEECQRGTIAQKLYYNAELRRITTMEEGAEFVAH